jgi:stage II sporulation protein D
VETCLESGPFHILLIFAFAGSTAGAREVTVRVNANDQTTKRLIRKISLEEYVAAALGGETAGFRSEEALRAMAIAARTYAVRFAGRHAAEGYDFCDTTHCQDVRFSAVTDRLRQAAEATEGELLWFAGAPASTFYGKDCGGSTESAGAVWPDLKASYLGAREDPYCSRERWSAEIRKPDLRGALTSAGILVPPRLDRLRIVGRTLSGRVARLDSGGIAISASSLRFAVGRMLGWSLVRSDLYELTDAGDRFVFEGRGSGHGVGLCQIGAERMGVSGRSYREILEFYYPGTKLGVTAQGLSWRSLAGERVEVITTRPREEQFLVALADRLARAVEERSGLRWEASPRLKIFPTVAAFRDSTGEPGWVAASARGRMIRLQPVAILRARGSIESTLEHELLHALIESRARAGLPLWFREGVVGYLTASQKSKLKRHRSNVDPPEDGAFLRGAEEARRAYAAAEECVTDLVERVGEREVLSWIQRGFAANLFPGAPSAPPGPARR